MNRRKQKKVNESKPSMTQSQIQPRPKIPASQIIISHKTIATRNSLIQLRVKKIYRRNMSIDESFSWFINKKEICKFCKAMKKTKFLQGLKITNSNMFRYLKFSKLSQFIPRVKSLEIEPKSLNYFAGFYGNRVDMKPIKHFFQNLKLNLTKLIVTIPFGYGYDDNMIADVTKCLTRDLRSMCNLKSFRFRNRSLQFGITFPYTEDLAIENQSSIAICQTQFQRLKKLENLQLISSVKPSLMMRYFDQDFTHLHQLKSLDLISFNAAYGKDLLEKIKKIHTLKCLTLANCIEPDDLLKFCTEMPNLRKLVIKDDWLFSSMALSPSIDPKKIHVIHLEFDIPLDIETPEDSTFICEFINKFKLHSLKLYLRCQDEKKVPPFDVIKSILKQKSLEGFTFGLLASPNLINESLKKLKGLNKLKKISLLMRPIENISWTHEYEATFEALESYIFQNKALNHLEIYWERLTHHCMERFQKFFAKAPKLNYFKLTFISPFYRHGTNHEMILSDLVSCLAQITTIPWIDIDTSCFLCDSKRSSSSLYEAAKQNKNIKIFHMLSAEERVLPFTGEKLKNS